MKIPSNVMRCVECNGPIKHGALGKTHDCVKCGRPVRFSEREQLGGYWAESYGYLALHSYDDDADERDTEEEIEDLYGALRALAKVFGDSLAASGVAGHFTCTETNDIVQSLMVGNQKREAMTFLEAHARADHEADDEHGDLLDYEAYVLELAGKKVPELIEEVEPATVTVTSTAVTISVDELVKLMNLD